MAEYFQTQFKSKGKYLKEIFSMSESLYKNSTDSKSVCFKIKDNRLIVMAGSSMFFKQEIELEENVNNSEVTILLKNVSEILEARDDVEVVMNSNFLSLRTDDYNIAFHVNATNVSDVDVDSHQFRLCDINKVKAGIKTLLSLNSINKLYNLGTSISILDSYMQMKYPTVYIQLQSNSIINNMSIECARVLLSFLEDSSICEIAEYSTYTVFKIENKYLSIPKSIPNGNYDLNEYIAKSQYRGLVSTRYLSNRVKKLYNTFGKGLLGVKFYTNYVELTRQTEEDNIAIIVGTKNSDSKFLDSISLQIEIFMTLTSVIGDIFKVYRKEGTICLVVNSTILILS